VRSYFVFPRLRLFIVLFALLLVTVPALAQDQTASTTESEAVTHNVTYGDSLYRIALRYGVTMDAIAQANGLTNWSHIAIGQTLIIPGLEVPDDSEVVVNPLIAGTPTTHIVQPGETLNNIAQKYNISIEDLLKSNNIANPNLIYRGQELTVWTSESVNEAADPVVETLPELTTSFPIDITGQPLVPDDFDVRVAPAIQTTHVVLAGETLARIASKYNVTWSDLVTANNLPSADRIYAGQELVIPAPFDPNLGAPGVITGEQGPAVVPPTPAITTGRFILVDLSDSRVYAYEDGKFVFTALGSMGVAATPTVQGQYKIYQRYPAQIMSGPGYYLPNVEWVQYFYQGYALHGAYWHSNWGQPMSHGCVNLRNQDAKWLYDFGEVGTPVWVQV
jgi:LysM repeat protein